MNTRIAVWAVGLFLAPTGVSAADATFVGVVTDTMCTTNHAPMGIAPDAKCVQSCVGDAKTFYFALATKEGTFALSDQAAPADHVGRRVRVVGVLYPKTKILKVTSITPIEAPKR